MSDDRARIGDGSRLQVARWSTPPSARRSFGGLTLASHGEARWQLADGTSFTCIELELLAMEHDPSSVRVPLRPLALATG